MISGLVLIVAAAVLGARRRCWGRGGDWGMIAGLVLIVAGVGLWVWGERLVRRFT